MNKEKYFTDELSYIKTERIKKDAIHLINQLPDYFFEVAASSSGKYHPSFALGAQGLLRHTKAAVLIADTYLSHPLVDNFSQIEKDIMILALIMHDGIKRADGKEHTAFEHPLLVSEKILSEKANLSFTGEELNLLTKVINSHMGPWNTNRYSNISLDIPEDKYQRLVHFADYYASRKFLDIKFDDNNNIIK